MVFSKCFHLNRRDHRVFNHVQQIGVESTLSVFCGHSNVPRPRLWSDSDTWPGAVLVSGGNISPGASLIMMGTLPNHRAGPHSVFPFPN